VNISFKPENSPMTEEVIEVNRLAERRNSVDPMNGFSPLNSPVVP
jgi:hypothetical protein